SCARPASPRAVRLPSPPDERASGTASQRGPRKGGLALARSLIALLLTVLLSCAARAEDQVTLNFWIGASPSLPMSIEEQKQIALFEKEHPDIHIATQYIVYGPLHDKLLTAIAGGDAPDVSWGLIEWFGELSRMGALRDMTPLVDQWPEKAK